MKTDGCMNQKLFSDSRPDAGAEIGTDADVKTTCAYCGVGCGFVVGQHGLRAESEHPANRGRFCVKGAALLETVGLDNRLLQPWVDGRATGWEEALAATTGRLRETIERYGPQAVAFYVSGQLLTEDYYVANKLMKGFIGSANIDTNSRLCMSTAVAAHKRVLGSDTVPGCYEDLELADLVVITGSNMAWTHPVIYQRIMAARAARPQMRLVVIDPRRTATAESADLHLQIAPGSDAYLFDGLLAYLIQHDALDQQFIREHTRDFSAVAAQTLQRSGSVVTVAERCGLPEQQLSQFLQWFASTDRTVTLFSQGINQSASGVDKVSSILHCHLATGRIGMPGACPFSITGQPNAMGGREVGGLANQLAAHMELHDPSHREIVQTFWQSPVIADKPGLKAVDLFDAIDSGQVKFVWIMATNPVVSLPDAARVQQALQKCDCVVVSDCVGDTDTLRLAHIRLPAAGWGEKDGTVTNSERCVSRQRAFLPLPGQARPDWWIISQVAIRLGYAAHFDYSQVADIFREHAALSGYRNAGTRDFDISALSSISPQAYADLLPFQWPMSAGSSASTGGTARMFTDGKFFTDDGLARFVPTTLQGTAAAPSDSFPLLMNTGRIRDQWHSMTRTGRSARLQQHRPEPFVECHPDDLARLGLREQQLALVSSAWGSCRLRAVADPGLLPGSVFAPIHWNDCFSGDARVDKLVAPLCDPVSGQPAYKQTAVSIRALDTTWQAWLFCREALQLPDVCYWNRRQLDGWHVVNMEGTGSFDIATIRSQLAQKGLTISELQDSEGETLRLIARDESKIYCGVYVASANAAVPADETWLLDALDDPSIALRQIAVGQAPVGTGAAGPLICTCRQVRGTAIEDAIRDGCHSTEEIGARTQAGTQCGSCVPELRRLLEAALAEVTV